MFPNSKSKKIFPIPIFENFVISNIININNKIKKNKYKILKNNIIYSLLLSVHSQTINVQNIHIISTINFISHFIPYEHSTKLNTTSNRNLFSAFISTAILLSTSKEIHRHSNPFSNSSNKEISAYVLIKFESKRKMVKRRAKPFYRSDYFIRR